MAMCVTCQAWKALQLSSATKDLLGTDSDPKRVRLDQNMIRHLFFMVVQRIDLD